MLIPLNLESKEYISTAHYLKEQVNDWLKQKVKREYQPIVEISTHLLPANRVIEYSRKYGTIIECIVETKTL
jgi:hypothetical protein